MNKIESCPKPDSEFEYILFIEIEATVNDAKIISMLDEIKNNCTDLIFLGNYKLD